MCFTALVYSVFHPAKAFEDGLVSYAFDEILVGFLGMEDRHSLQREDVAGFVHIAVFDGKGGFVASFFNHLGDVEVGGIGGIGHIIHFMAQFAVCHHGSLQRLGLLAEDDHTGYGGHEYNC